MLEKMLKKVILTLFKLRNFGYLCCMIFLQGKYLIISSPHPEFRVVQPIAAHCGLLGDDFSVDVCMYDVRFVATLCSECQAK